MTIQDIIIGKLIGKNIDLIDDSIKFNELANKYIDVIGSAMTNVINNSEDSIEKNTLSNEDINNIKVFVSEEYGLEKEKIEVLS